MAWIDSHVHAFPERLAWAVRNALNVSGRLTASPLLPDVAEAVRNNGFEAAWILPYAHKAGVAETLNEWSAEEVARYDWLVAGATFHPDDDNLDILVSRALVGLGLRVVKLHCSVGDFSVADPRLAPLWEVAAERRVPVVAHAGHRQQGGTEPDELDEVAKVLREHPSLRLILAHSASPSEQGCLALMDEFPNLYADLTPIMDRRIDLPVEALNRFAGRFLFGSDSPNNPHTAKLLASEFEEAGLEEGPLEMLLGGTAASLVS